MTTGLFFALGVMIAVFYLPYTGAAIRWRRSIRKTLPVTLFALAAFMGGGPIWLVMALGFSAVGDFALSREGDRAFLIGMLAFAAAHLAYTYQIVLLGADVAVLPLQIIAAFFTLVVSTEFWLTPYTRELKWPVRGYVVIIATMGAMAMALPMGYAWAKAGAVLFIVSDFILSFEVFVMGQGHRLQKLAGKAVWVTYIFAQAALFFGFAVL